MSSQSRYAPKTMSYSQRARLAWVTRAKNHPRDPYGPYKRWERTRNWVRQYKADHGCIDCGEKDWRCLDFDHVRGEKQLAIANNFNLSLARIKSEIEKCVVRCSNCHRKRHADERGARQRPWMRRIWRRFQV